MIKGFAQRTRRQSCRFAEVPPVSAASSRPWCVSGQSRLHKGTENCRLFCSRYCLVPQHGPAENHVGTPFLTRRFLTSLSNPNELPDAPGDGEEWWTMIRLPPPGGPTPRNSLAGTSGVESAASPTRTCAAVHRPSSCGRKASPTSATKCGGRRPALHRQQPGMGPEQRQALASCPDQINRSIKANQERPR